MPSMQEERNMTKFGKLEAHLLTRNYRHDIHPYRQWIDESEGVVTFPLYRFDGMLAGYQTYRPVLLSSIAIRRWPGISRDHMADSYFGEPIFL